MLYIIIDISAEDAYFSLHLILKNIDINFRREQGVKKDCFENKNFFIEMVMHI